MAAVAGAASAAPTHDDARVWLSAAIGYVSLACWVVVMFPQIVLNYRRKSGEGVSLVMMVAWVVGDVFNIAGALMQNLVMSTVLIGSYYLLVDSTLLAQTIYYRPRRAPKDYSSAPDTRPLLADSSAAAEGAGLAGGTGLDSAVERQQSPPPPPRHASRLQTVLALGLSLTSVGMLLAMLAALLVGAPPTGGGDPAPGPAPVQQLVAQALGTASAVVYIMSYVPQAVQNQQRKSCEGLSMWLFLLSLLGNTTYALAILVVSLDPSYLAPYVPWLLGALVPCLIHIVILYQFYTYAH